MVRWLRWHCPPDTGFEIRAWRSETEHATSRSRRLPTILTFTRGWGRNNFVSFKPPRPGTEPRTLAWKAAVLTTTLGPPPSMSNMHSKHEILNNFCFNAGPALQTVDQHCGRIGSMFPWWNRFLHAFETGFGNSSLKFQMRIHIFQIQRRRKVVYLTMQINK